MRLIALYRPNSEYARIFEEFIREYQARHNDQSIDIINIDTRDGVAVANLYDVVQYPAIIVLQNDGYLQKVWQGPKLPLIEEVATYANN
jgi:hypothetical protein